MTAESKRVGVTPLSSPAMSVNLSQPESQGPYRDLQGLTWSSPHYLYDLICFSPISSFLLATIAPLLFFKHTGHRAFALTLPSNWNTLPPDATCLKSSPQLSLLT